MKNSKAQSAGLRTIAIVLSLSAPALLLSQAANAQKNVNVKTVTKTLNSSAAHKECTSLAAAQNLRYWFRADAPVSFNIQYQEGGQVLYPVKKDKVNILSGTYVPKTPGDICIVWTNLNAKPVTLSFEFARIAAGH
jgi:hypothetical protein